MATPGKKTHSVSAASKKRSIVSARDKEVLMVLLLRRPEVFEEAKDTLKTEHFSAADAHYALAWRVVLQFYEEYDQLPSRELMFAEIDSALEDNPDLLTDEEVESLNAVVDLAFDDEYWAEDDKLKTTWGLKTLRRFLQERLAHAIREEVKSAGQVVVELGTYLEETRERSDVIDAIGTTSQATVFPDGWDAGGGVQKRPTGLPFLDHFLNGGDVDGEVYGLMGPYGACKTTIAVNYAVSKAKQAAERKQSPDWDGSHGFSVLVTYEARMQEVRNRVLMFDAKIPRKSLEDMGPGGLATLSDSDHLKPYEKRRYKKAIKAGRKVRGEQERAKTTMAMINEHLIVLDMTGHGEGNRGVGSGYVEEIARRIKWELRKRKVDNATIDAVVIDYAGVMAKRHLVTSDKDENHLRHLIGGAPLRAKTLIADYYDCPVWIMHQLDKKGNEKTAGADMHYTLAAEAKNFAENLDFCFVVGALTPGGICVIHSTKHRRTRAMKQQVLRLYGEIHRIVVADDMVLKNQKIVAKSVLQSTAEESTPVTTSHKSSTEKKKPKSTGHSEAWTAPKE